MIIEYQEVNLERHGGDGFWKALKAKSHLHLTSWETRSTDGFQKKGGQKQFIKEDLSNNGVKI